MATHTRPRLTAERRYRVGKKSELRQLRREGLVPGSLFGHGDPEMIRVPEKDLNSYLRRHSPGGLLDLDVEGRTTCAIIREVDRDGVTGQIINLGLQRIDLGESIKAAIPLQFVGEAEVNANDLVLQRQTSEVEVTGRADLLPESIIVNVADAENGTVIRIADLDIPEGLTPTKDPDLPVASVSIPSIPADVEAALDAEEAAAAEARMENLEAAEAEEAAGEGAAEEREGSEEPHTVEG